MDHNIQKILIAKPSSLGDILHIFPALELLKKHYPEAQMDFLVNPEFAPLLDFSPFPIRRRIIFERRKLAALRTAPEAFFKLLGELRRERYDLVIDFQGLFWSAFVCRLTRHRKHSIWGFAAPREKISALFYSHRVSVSAAHAVEKNTELANRVTGDTSEVPDPVVPVHPDCSDFTAKLPADYLLVMPGARWHSKTFPSGLFAQTMSLLRSKGSDTVFITAGSKADMEKSAEIRNLLPADFPLLDLTGKTSISELFELVRNARAVLCNDSGPMHIAALLKVPVFSFFGPTNPEKTGPWQQGSRVFSLPLDCSRCMNRVCPKAETACHKIDPELVSDAIFKQIFQEERMV